MLFITHRDLIQWCYPRILSLETLLVRGYLDVKAKSNKCLSNDTKLAVYWARHIPAEGVQIFISFLE